MTKPWVHEPWAEAYRLALREINPTKLPKRIKTAETTIMARIVELQGPAGRPQELDTLFDALKALHGLDRDLHRKKAGKLNRPHLNPEM